MFEVTKAAIVLLLGCGLFHLMHNNLDDVAERVVQVLHVSPEGKLSNLFLSWPATPVIAVCGYWL
jgi:hypothetical protein